MVKEKQIHPSRTWVLSLGCRGSMAGGVTFDGQRVSRRFFTRFDRIKRGRGWVKF